MRLNILKSVFCEVLCNLNATSVQIENLHKIFEFILCSVVVQLSSRFCRAFFFVKVDVTSSRKCHVRKKISPIILPFFVFAFYFILVNFLQLQISSSYCYFAIFSTSGQAKHRANIVTTTKSEKGDDDCIKVENDE